MDILAAVEGVCPCAPTLKEADTIIYVIVL